MGQELQLELQCLFLEKKYLRQALKYVSLTFSLSFLLSDKPSVLSADVSSTSFFPQLQLILMMGQCECLKMCWIVTIIVNLTYW